VEGPDVYGILQMAGESLCVSSSLSLPLLMSATRSRQWENNSGPIFVLHDGPPYANGHLHMGHALNKVVKDFINRYKALRGYRVK
jgi:hypothetical protein